MDIDGGSWGAKRTEILLESTEHSGRIVLRALRRRKSMSGKTRQECWFFLPPCELCQARLRGTSLHPEALVPSVCSRADIRR